MKKDIITRNLERLIYSDYKGEKEPIEPMSEWKWRQLYQLARQYRIGAWVKEGLHNYADDFFLQLSPELQRLFQELPAEKDEESLARFQLHIDRHSSRLARYSSRSLRAYAEDLLRTIRNIEE
jgi:hypothetical protein